MVQIYTTLLPYLNKKDGIGMTFPIMIKPIPLQNKKLGKPFVLEEFGIMSES
jgi:hypothetical protein